MLYYYVGTYLMKIQYLKYCICMSCAFVNYKDRGGVPVADPGEGPSPYVQTKMRPEGLQKFLGETATPLISESG